MRRRPWGRAAAVGLAGTVLVVPAAQAACEVDRTSAFPPGHWVAFGVEVARDLSDDVAVGSQSGQAQFQLDVDDGGQVDGELQMHGTGALSRGVDDGVVATWRVDADLRGTAASVVAEGGYSVDLEGSIGMGGSDGQVSSGPESMGFEGGFSREIRFDLVPVEVDCASAIGTLDTGLAGDGNGGPAYFLAVRVGGPAGPTGDARDAMESTIEQARLVLDAEQPDPAQLHALVRRVLGLAAHVRSSAACGGEAFAGSYPGHTFLAEVTQGVLMEFLMLARQGTYTTREIIEAMTAGVAGGGLTSVSAGCAAELEDDPGETLFRTFEDLLLERLQDAWDAGDQRQVTDIRAAALQFGLERIVELQP